MNEGSVDEEGMLVEVSKLTVGKFVGRKFSEGIC